MQKEIDRFLKFLVSDRDCSKNTIAAYSTDLIQFLDFLETAYPPSQSTAAIAWADLTVETMHAYLQYLEKNKYASSTVARKIAAVKSYFQYAVQEGILADDPTSGLSAPKVEKNPPRLIGYRDVTRLLAAPAQRGALTSQRDKALLEMLYTTGLRVTELISLNTDDYDPRAKTILCGIREKRTVPVHSDTATYLETYLNDGRSKQIATSSEKALFLNHRGRRLTRQGLWLIIKRYAKQVGISESVTPHTLRHSFAAHLINSGAELKDVQHRLGHANLSTTHTYRQSISEMSEIVVDGEPVKS